MLLFVIGSIYWELWRVFWICHWCWCSSLPNAGKRSYSWALSRGCSHWWRCKCSQRFCVFLLQILHLYRAINLVGVFTPLRDWLLFFIFGERTPYYCSWTANNSLTKYGKCQLIWYFVKMAMTWIWCGIQRYYYGVFWKRNRISHTFKVVMDSNCTKYY